MKAPNFKITICGLNLYLSVHCVLFVLFAPVMLLFGEI